ncbi:DUF2642 domain-containing protein [Paenibacillus sp. HJL G12]|uniref:DUF2642 domain-containing protein n=1 Tax=Paenibacillus dendrobii TaxID=2691084 RepID=A0A7X3IL60_9BACL|nr:DUF2642 domain-containing protein [Paenibacillus dendrobii]MWV45972.1 DUF2642 domain-containing protein [Paenibacillus dendrobii]
MESIRSLLGKYVELKISGCKIPIAGELVDLGSDIIVIFSETRYMYVPIHHLQHLRLSQDGEDSSSDGKEPLVDHTNISYRKMLMNSRGIFTEIDLGGPSPLHGYVTSIMNDYFIFYSPLYHSVYIPLHHVKYICPLPPNMTPFYLSQHHFQLQQPAVSLSRTLEQQLEKFQNELVIFDLGESPLKAGLLKKVDNRIMELVEAGGNTIFLHCDHVKSVHLP